MPFSDVRELELDETLVTWNDASRLFSLHIRFTNIS